MFVPLLKGVQSGDRALSPDVQAHFYFESDAQNFSEN